MAKRSFIFVVAVTLAFFLISYWFGPSKVPTPVAHAEITQEAPQERPSPGAEKFYVLENDQMQLVFSNFGGALAEINLTLKDKEHPKSPVRPIQFDRTMRAEYPYNDAYPAFPYAIATDGGTETKQPALGGYYPLLRRTIMGPNDTPLHRIPSEYYGLNIVREGSGSSDVYQLKRLEKERIEFELSSSKGKITKIFTLPKDPGRAPYAFDVQINVEGDARGLYLGSGIPDVELISGSSNPALKYLITKSGKKPEVITLSLPKGATSSANLAPNWISNSNGFFGLILNPLSDIGTGYSAARVAGDIVPSRLTLIDAEYKRFPASKYPGYQFQLPLRASPMQFRVYAGPYMNDVLERVDAAFADPSTGYNPNYVKATSFRGWFTFISEPFAKFLFFLMKIFYKVTASWGAAIILLTVALRIMLYPLNAWSIKSSLKMQHLAPKITALQERYKRDPQRLKSEMIALYREKGVNPFSGCIPMVIQLPFLVGMFDLLKSTFELRGAPFIPGWINNLSAPDVVFSWKYPILFFGTSFHLLPLLLGGIMWFQQKMSVFAPKNKALLTDQQKQQRMMGNVLTIVFAVMFYHFPSGLNIYWLSSMGLGILQQIWMRRRMTPKKIKIQS